MNNIRDQLVERYFSPWPNMEAEWQEWKAESDVAGNTVVMIPARSGSTRLVDKNIRDVCGQPLLAYTTMIANAVQGVDRVLCSTDSQRYGRIAEKYGAEAPFLRPKSLAGTQASSVLAYYHMLCHFVKEKYPVKTVITMVPTSPFRNVASIQEMVDATKRTGMCQTVFRPATSPDEATLGLDGRIPFKGLGIFSGKHVNNMNVEAKKLFFITNPFELIDIDTDDDLCLAESVIENGLYDFGRTPC